MPGDRTSRREVFGSRSRRIEAWATRKLIGVSSPSDKSTSEMVTKPTPISALVERSGSDGADRM
jgi:hypothetical protein